MAKCVSTRERRKAKGCVVKLENSTLILLGCRLPKWKMRCCSSVFMWSHSGSKRGQRQNVQSGNGKVSYNG